MTEKTDNWSWMKFLSGLFNPLNFAKSFVFMVQMSIIILLILSVVFAAISIKRKFLKPKKSSAPVQIQTASGPVHNSVDDNKKKYGLINLW